MNQANFGILVGESAFPEGVQRVLAEAVSITESAFLTVIARIGLGGNWLDLQDTGESILEIGGTPGTGYRIARLKYQIRKCLKVRYAYYIHRGPFHHSLEFTWDNGRTGRTNWAQVNGHG